MPNVLNVLQQEGWSLSEKGYEQCVKEVGEEDVAKLKSYLLDVCL